MPDTATLPTNALANTAAQQAASPAKTGNTSAISSDFDTFLRMLTVQLKNQDPLNPVEATDYAVQLATFSGVEQQVKSNDLLTALGNQMQMLSLGQFSGWVGKQARHAGPAHFGGQPMSISTSPAAGSDRASLIIRDATDNVVQRYNIPPQGGEVAWSGLDNAGNPFPHGLYRFSVESFSGQVSTDIIDAEPYSMVTEARNTPGGASLGLAGGISIATDAVTAIRTPPGS